MKPTNLEEVLEMSLEELGFDPANGGVPLHGLVHGGIDSLSDLAYNLKMSFGNEDRDNTKDPEKKRNFKKLARSLSKITVASILQSWKRFGEWYNTNKTSKNARDVRNFLFDPMQKLMKTLVGIGTPQDFLSEIPFSEELLSS